MNRDAGAAAESSASRARDRDRERLQPANRGRKKKRPARTGPIDPPYLVTAPPSALTPPPESDANLILPSAYVRSLNSPRPGMAARGSNGSLQPSQPTSGRQSYAANFLSPPTIMATTPSSPRPPPSARGGYAATLLSPPSIMPGGRPSEPLVQRPARHTRLGSHSDLREMGAFSPSGSGDERDRDRDREGRTSPNPRRRRRRVVQESIRRQRSQTVSSAEEGRAIGLSRGASMRRVNLWDDLPDQETVDGDDPPPPFPFPTASNVRAPPTFTGSLPPIPDSPPPSFDIALASPLPLHEPSAAPALADTGPSSSSPPSEPPTSPQARRSLPTPPTEVAASADAPSPTEEPSSDEDAEVDTRVDRRQWNADILAGYTLEERVAREHARQQARTPVLEAEARRAEAERQAADDRRREEEEEAQRRVEEERKREEIRRREDETRRREEEEAARRQQEVADRQAEEDARVRRREAEEAARRAEAEAATRRETEAAAAAAAAATRAAEEEARLRRREEEEAARRAAAEEAKRREAMAAALRQAEEEARAALAEAEAAARAAKVEAAAAKKREDDAARARRAEMAAAAMRRHEIEEALREAAATHPVSKTDLHAARYQVVNELGGRPATRAEIAEAARAALGSKALSKPVVTTSPQNSDKPRAVVTPSAQQPLFSSPAYQHPITSPRRNDKGHEATELLDSPRQVDRGGDPSSASKHGASSDPSTPEVEGRRASYPAMTSARGAPPPTHPSADDARPTPSRSSTAPTDSRAASVASQANRATGSRASLGAGGGSGPRPQDVPKDQQQRRLSGPRPNGKATPTSPRSPKTAARDKIFSRLDPIASGSASRADTPAPLWSSALEEFGAFPTRSPEASTSSRLSVSGATSTHSRRQSSIASDGHPDARSRSSSVSGQSRSRSSSVSGPRPMPHSLRSGSDPRMSDAPPVPTVPAHLRTPSQTLAAFKFPLSTEPAKLAGPPEPPAKEAQAPEPPAKLVQEERGLTLSPVALTSALPIISPVPTTSSLPSRSPAGATSPLPPKGKEQDPIQPPRRSDSLNSDSSYAHSVSVRPRRPSHPSHWPAPESRSTTALSNRSTPSLSKSNPSVSGSGVSSSTQSPVISVSQTPWDHRAFSPEHRKQVDVEDEDKPPPVPPKDHISPVPWAHATSPLSSKPDELPIVPMIPTKADELPIVPMRPVEPHPPARSAPPPPSAWRQVGGTWQKVPTRQESSTHVQSTRQDTSQTTRQDTDSQPQQSALFHRLTLARRGRSIDLLKHVLSPPESSQPNLSAGGASATVPLSATPPDAEVLQTDNSDDSVAGRRDVSSAPRPESLGLSMLMESSSALLSLLEQEEGSGESSAQGAARSALADEVRQQLEIEAAIRSEHDRVDQATRDLALALSLDNGAEDDTASDAALAAALQAEDYARQPAPTTALTGQENEQWPALPVPKGKGKARAPPPPTAPKPDRIRPPKPTRAPPLPPRHSNEPPALPIRETAASSSTESQEQDKDVVPPSKRDTQYMIASFPIPPVPSRNPATPSSPAPRLPPIRPSRPLSQFPPARASQFIQPDDAPPLPTTPVPPLPSNAPLSNTTAPTTPSNVPGRTPSLRRAPPPPPRPASGALDEAPLIQLDDDPSAVAQFKRHQALHSISSSSSSSLLDDISSAVGHHGHGFSPARNAREHGEDSVSSVSAASTTRSAWRSSISAAGGTPARRPGGPRSRRDPPPVPPRPWARDGASPTSEQRNSTGSMASSTPTSALATPTRLSVYRSASQLPPSASGEGSPPSERPDVSRTVSRTVSHEGVDRNRLSVDRPQMLRSGSSSSSMFAGLRLDAQGQLIEDATGRATSPLAAESSAPSPPIPASGGGHSHSATEPSASGPTEPSTSQPARPESPVRPEEPTYAEITDVDLYASRVLGGDHEYEGLNHLINFLGPAKEPGATPEQLAYLSAAPVHVDSRRVNAAGKVKIKLSVLGVRVTNCPVCLAQYRSEDAAVLLPCGHVAHETCARRWFRESDGCMVCRTKLGEERGSGE